MIIRQEGMPIDFTDEKMMMYAIQSGDLNSVDGRLAVIELLLQRGASIAIAKEHGDEEILDLLSKLLYDKMDKEIPLKENIHQPKI